MREKIGTAVLELTTEGGKMFRDLDELERRAGTLDKSWRDTGKTLQTFGKQTSDVGSALTKMSLPIVAIGVGAARAAIEFESSFAGVRKTVNATEEEFTALSDEFRAMAKTIPVNVNELNRLGEAAGALGIPKAEIVDFARVMAMLGVTTNVTSEEAAESIAKIQNIFGAAGKDTDRFASTLVALGNDGASTEKQILELANRIASAGNAVGLTQGQVLGFASAIANVGIEAEAGGTAMSKTLIEISQAVSKGGGDLEAFARVAGLSSAEFAKAFKTDAADATRIFIEGLGRIKAEGGDLNTVIESLGVKEVRQANLLRSLALSGDNVAKSLNLQATAWRENSALTAEAGKRFETLQSQGQLLWNRLQDVAISIGNALVPSIKLAINSLTGLVPMLEGAVKRFTELPPVLQATAVGFGAVLIAAGPVLFVVGQLITQVGVVVKTLWSLGNTVPVLTARLWLMDAAAGSVGGVFGGLASVIATVGRVLMGPFGLAIAGLDLAIRGLTGNSSSLFTVLKDIATVVADQLFGALSTVWSILKAWATTISTFLSEAGTAFLRWVKDSIPGVKEFGELLGWLSSKFKQVTKDGTDYWAAKAQLVRDEKEVGEWLEETSNKLAEQSAAARKAATSTDLLAGANAVLAKEWAATEERAGKVAAATAKTEEEMKAAKKAAEEFAASLKALGGADALAGGREVLKQLQALGGPLNVLPGKLNEMAERLREAGQAAMLSGNAKLAGDYEQLAKTLSPVIQFQQRYNVTIGEYATDAAKAADFTNDLWEQIHRLKGEVQTIGPVLKSNLDLSKLFTGFKGTVKENLPDSQQWAEAWSSMKTGLGVTLASVPATLAKAFEGGGDMWGAIKSIGTQIGSGIGGAIGFGIGGPGGQKIGEAIGSLVGPALEGFKRLFRIGINEEVKKANVEIDKLRNGLLDTHGPLDQLEKKANLVGLSFEQNWGHQGQRGLKAMTELMAEFERRTEAVAAAAEQAVSSFNAVAGGMTKPWIDLGERQKKALEEADSTFAKLNKLRGDEKSSIDAITEAEREHQAAVDALDVVIGEQAASAVTAKQTLADLGVQAVGTFAVAIASGKTYGEAIAAIGPGVRNLSDSYKAVGLEIEDAGLQQLVLASNVAKTNPELIGAASAHGQSLQALAQMGMLNAERFAAMQRTGSEMHTRLQAEFAGTEEGSRLALLPMQDYLHQAQIQATELGLPLDANTQMLIDQSVELGIWKEQGASAQDRLIAGMDALVVKVSALVDQLLGVSDAIGSIPAHKTITIEAQYFDPGAPDGFGSGAVGGVPILPMAEGGMGRVTSPTLFLAGEAGSEDFAFSGGGRSFGENAPGGDLNKLRDDFRELRREMARDRRLQPSLNASALRDALAMAGVI